MLSHSARRATLQSAKRDPPLRQSCCANVVECGANAIAGSSDAPVMVFL
jgi:hypothetical protein